jgi:hypothetical protein
MVILLVIGLCWGCSPFLLCVLIHGAIASFNISRALYKKNRGVFSSCFVSGEWWLTVSGISFVVAMTLFGGLEREKAAVIIVMAQVIYNIGRGISKGVGVKTQTIMR